MKSKTILFILVFVLLIGTFQITAYGYGSDYVERFQLNHVVFIDIQASRVWIHGKIVDFHTQYSTPIILENGRSFAPIRFMTEEMGAKVLWDGEDSIASVSINNNTSKFFTKTGRIEVNGVEIKEGVNMKIINDRIYLPVRFIAENLLKKSVGYENYIVAIGSQKEINLLKSEKYLFYKMLSLIRNYSENPLFLIKQDEKYGYIYSDGTIAIEPTLMYADEFSEGLAAIRDKNGKCGFIDESGKWVIEPQFTEVLLPFNEGNALVRTKEGRYYINIKGQKLVNLDVNLAYKEGVAITQKYGGWALVNMRGEIIKCTDYRPLVHFEEGRARIQGANGKYGFIDYDGKIIVEPKYDMVHEFAEGLAAIEIDDSKGSIGYVNLNGEMVIEPKFELAAGFFEGLACVQYDGKWGYIDRKGDFVIEPIYDNASIFSEGYSLVKLDSEYFYIDRQGNVAVDMDITYAEDYNNGLAFVYSMEQDKTGYIDKIGNWVWYKKFELSDLNLY